MSTRREFLQDLAGATAGIVFTGCGFASAALGAMQAGRAVKRREVMVGGRRVRTVDIHAHCEVPTLWIAIKDHPQAKALRDPITAPIGPAESLSRVEDRLKDLDERGIDVQALSINPFWYETPPDLARLIVKIQNEAMAEVCAAHPDRFVGLATVALQHPDLAAEQLEEAVKKLGMRGCLVHANVNGAELASPKFHPFWAKAEALGCLVFIHPAGFRRDEPRFRGNGTLGNVIGNPLDTTVALSHLIFEGTLDRFPGVKICAAHGGGYLPSFVDRAGHCVEYTGNWPADCKAVGKLPSEYMKQLYFDSLVYSAEGLRHLVAEAGASQILLGTDYPAGMGDPKAVDHILNTPGLSDAERRAMLGENASKLLRLNS